ncbi:hypothetical protein QBC34DRAFT_124392 [Podospora aff. communis PSN243]|uniref:Uncharacterized protein n=1 Tax=Podospora aff. communis PSN243 TaxID=3040156 RepID=A0AAV9GI01_9PEZI|nr:hypothetical protein QBC34DRAFT_124392 [Podospora aff. communis PSN243]
MVAKHVILSSKSTERHTLLFGKLHSSGREFEPKAQTPQPGSTDLSFLVEDDIDKVLARLHTAELGVPEGGQVVDRTGARSKAAHQVFTSKSQMEI